MNLRTAINTNERESNIHESLYFVSFMNLNAIDAAMICRTIEIMSAISLTILTGYCPAKIEVIYSITIFGAGKYWLKGTKVQRSNAQKSKFQ
jgi:hypothetical protein